MERLVEQLVAWHNRHPLALRIAPGDVHTLGIVALPFMRGSRPAEASEPTLTDEVSEEEALARAADAASRASAPAASQAWWKAFDPRQLFASPTRGLLGELPWPVFSERFIPGLRQTQVAQFALAHGYTTQPGEADWPQRIVAIDESLVAKAGHQAWPMELYLASAGIDAGVSHTRVLIGQGHGSELLILGRRCLDKRRVAALGLLLAALLALPAWLLWPTAGPQQEAPPSAASAPAVAASAVSAAAASAPASAAAAPAAEPVAVAASQPGMTASAPASVPTQAVASAPASASTPAPAPVGVTAAELPNELAPPGTIPSIRPNMVSTPRTRKAAAEAASQAASQPPRPAMAAAASAPEPKPAKKPEPAPAPAASAAGTLSGEAPSEAAKTATARLAARSQSVVALVGPSVPSKSDAEAMLARMRAMVAQTVGDRSRLQAEVMQTPEGWRATIWPFATREEAQLINATLIARGMKTRAVDF
jgi:hypothetical protein